MARASSSPSAFSARLPLAGRRLVQAPGIPAGTIGHRLDGWANRDLDVGAIIALAPDLRAFATLLGVDEATVRTVLTRWGPGKFDAQLTLDGKGFRPDGKTAATLIPPRSGWRV